MISASRRSASVIARSPACASARAALQRIERRHFGEAEVAVHAVELCEQGLVTLGRRHRRIAAGVEADLRVGAGGMVGDDRGHFRFHALDLLG